MYVCTFINAGITDSFQSNCHVHRPGLGITDLFAVRLSQTTAAAQVCEQIAYLLVFLDWG